ncbi:aminotransferase class IV [Ancylobacter defluvii]|uniref:Probable branched-chain-amino-acid aminotransferase n=1 Tax=Ancylobacter defluvii TaxID=1282440 RepID=A0A9W6N9I6_9HYPH|nr:aminotransferase class IV [Ancylobacter defluvii]MBS7587775.1 aminotransferase class IV [Ancylobacter defluvii]GLK82585.1 2-keto-4-methylthiobutyrate aminotransferase [Ancylobacter defluvii]
MTASVSVEDRGFTLGDGVFDTALALGGTVFARARHVERLLSACAAIGIAVARTRIEKALDAALTPAPTILRTTVTRGTTARGLWPASVGEPTVVVTAAPWSPALLGQKARLVTASGRRNEFSPTANLKAIGYLDAILAAREAAQAGVDDALLLNTRGRVACTTITNVFAVIGGRLVTPGLTEGCLPGIVRGLVCDIAPELGLAVEERPLAPAELGGAEAVFLSNSVRLLRPATALDGAPLAAGSAVIEALMDELGRRVAAECGVALTLH